MTKKLTIIYPLRVQAVINRDISASTDICNCQCQAAAIMYKLPGFSMDDASTSQSAASISALNHTVDYISNRFNLDYQDRGREFYGPNRNLLDRRFSFCL